MPHLWFFDKRLFKLIRLESYDSAFDNISAPLKAKSETERLKV